MLNGQDQNSERRSLRSARPIQSRTQTSIAIKVIGLPLLGSMSECGQSTIDCRRIVRPRVSQAAQQPDLIHFCFWSKRTTTAVALPSRYSNRRIGNKGTKIKLLSSDRTSTNFTLQLGYMFESGGTADILCQDQLRMGDASF